MFLCLQDGQTPLHMAASGRLDGDLEGRLACIALLLSYKANMELPDKVLLLNSFIHLFIHAFLHSFIHSFIHPFILSFVRLFVHSSIHSFSQMSSPRVRYVMPSLVITVPMCVYAKCALSWVRANARGDPS